MFNARRHAARIAGISCIAALAAGGLGVASAEAAPMVQHHVAAHSTSHQHHYDSSYRDGSRYNSSREHNGSEHGNSRHDSSSHDSSRHDSYRNSGSSKSTARS
ncbi:hypothetical protein JK361_38320, partial [Streptomyces sp. 5-8]